MPHYEPRAKDRIVTDEHPGYDARAHWCGEDARYVRVGDVPEQDTTVTFTGTPENPTWIDGSMFGAPTAWEEITLEEYDTRTMTNLRRVRAWADFASAAWRIVRWLLVFSLGFATGVYAESAVWR